MFHRGVRYAEVYGIQSAEQKTPLGQRPLSSYPDPNDPHAGPAAHAGVPERMVPHRPLHQDYVYPGHLSGAMGGMHRAQAASTQVCAPHAAHAQAGSLFGMLVLALLFTLCGLAVAELCSQRKTRQAVRELQISLLAKSLRG